MSSLERRYRRVLRLLPADYRAEWEEEMVGTFLLARQADQSVDDADFDAEYGHPGCSEVVSVVALASRLHLGGVSAPPRAFARGEVVRRVALAGLLAHSVAAIVGILSLLVTQRRFPDYRVPDLDTVWALAGLLWVGAFLALLADRRHVAGWLGAAALVPVVVNVSVVLSIGGASVEASAYRLLLYALPVLALAAFHRDAPPVRVRPWLVALPVGTVVVMAMAFATQAPGAVVLDWPGMLCLATIIAGAVQLVRQRRGPWTGALVVIAVGLFGERVLTLLDYVRFGGPDPETALLIIAGVAQVGALVLVMTTLVRKVVRMSST